MKLAERALVPNVLVSFLNTLRKYGFGIIQLDSLPNTPNYLVTLPKIPNNIKSVLTSFDQKILVEPELIPIIQQGDEFVREPSIINAVRYILTYMEDRIQELYLKQVSTQEIETLHKMYEKELKTISITEILEGILKLCEIKKTSKTASIPTQWGMFQFIGFEDSFNRRHLAIFKGDIQGQGLITRVHSECITGDVFGSLKCDCGNQLQQAFEKINTEGRGIVIYLNQEGRGIGIINKLTSYYLQEQDSDTVTANHDLGFPNDIRDFQIACKVLQHLKVSSIRLLTNNPQKVEVLRSSGLNILEQLNLIVEPCEHNLHYLQTKEKKLGHILGSL